MSCAAPRVFDSPGWGLALLVIPIFMLPVMPLVFFLVGTEWARQYPAPFVGLCILGAAALWSLFALRIRRVSKRMPLRLIGVSCHFLSEKVTAITLSFGCEAYAQKFAEANQHAISKGLIGMRMHHWRRPHDHS